ncbi:MAG: hypothetical protein IBJ10_02255 [Phycisphaerales bacterium]|nr:hypothetical protein [Phycisphaerales bacterium]
MAVVEKFNSPAYTSGPNASGERRYGIIRSDNDDDAAHAELLAAAPETFNGLPRLDVRTEPIGPGLWDGEAIYGVVNVNYSGPPETGQSVYSFDTGGATQRITQSKETMAVHAPAGVTAPDFKGAINVTADSVEGVDVTIPAYEFSETHYLANAAVDSAFRTNVANLTGKVNDATFRGFAAGEVLFRGASGTKRGGPDGDDWELSFRFSVSRNVTGLTIGDMTDIDKGGWEYLWVRYAEEVDDDADAVVKRPIAVFIERVYDEGDFSELGIGA